MIKNNGLKTKAQQMLKAFVPASVIQSRLHKRVFVQFAEKLGMVYFGYVDQRSDEHRLIRGLTVSSVHRDEHYILGSYQDYDVSLVERFDTIRFPGKPVKAHDWIIMTFDLHTTHDLPHVFVGLHTHSATFYAHLFTKFSHLTKLPLGAYQQYNSSFVDRYAIYTAPGHMSEVQELFTNEVTKVIAEHFGTLTLEIADGCLYIYAEHQRPTTALLEKMLKNGAWLAAALDQQSSHLHESNG